MIRGQHARTRGHCRECAVLSLQVPRRPRCHRQEQRASAPPPCLPRVRPQRSCGASLYTAQNLPSVFTASKNLSTSTCLTTYPFTHCSELRARSFPSRDDDSINTGSRVRFSCPPSLASSSRPALRGSFVSKTEGRRSGDEY